MGIPRRRFFAHWNPCANGRPIWSASPVRNGDHVVLVAVNDVVWIKTNRNSVEIHLAGQVHELRETMAALAARLDSRRFVRIHRSAIINVHRVKSIHPWFNGHHIVTMDTGQQLRMSRYQHEAFLKLMTTRSFNPPIQ